MDPGKIPTKTRLFDPQVFVFHLKKKKKKKKTINKKPSTANKPNTKF